MHVTIHSSELKRMMRTAKEVLNARSVTPPALEVGCTVGKFTLRAVNSEMGAKAYAQIMSATDEAVRVDGKTFDSVVSKMNGDVDIITDGKVLTLKCGGMRTKLTLMDGTVPEMEGCSGQTAEMDAAQLAAAFSRVGYASAVDQTRAILSGVLMEGDGTEMTLVALDGYQLSMEVIPYTGDAVRMVVPLTVLKAVCASAQDGKLTMETDGKRVRAYTEDMEISAGLLHGEYIDYKRILPTTSSTTARLDGRAMLEALKGASAVAGEKEVVRLDFGKDRLLVACVSESADFAAEVPCEVIGSDLKVAFSNKFLTNAVSNSGDNVEIKMMSSVSAAVFLSEDSMGLRLALPVRVL